MAAVLPLDTCIPPRTKSTFWHDLLGGEIGLRPRIQYANVFLHPSFHETFGGPRTPVPNDGDRQKSNEGRWESKLH